MTYKHAMFTVMYDVKTGKVYANKAYLTGLAETPWHDTCFQFFIKNGLLAPFDL